ncbi:MAG: hypothetical protein HC836_10650 [Richelia sp. RM2_1_2]|nr:hypothetical protein [Richelia sp. RM2_1_2]
MGLISWTPLAHADVEGEIDCQMQSIREYRDPVSGQVVFKRGEIINSVTGVEVAVKDNTEAYCTHGGGCYPRYQAGHEVFRLLNCQRTLGAEIYEGMRTDVLLFNLEPLGTPRTPDDRR